MQAISQYGWFNHFCLYHSFNYGQDIGDFLPENGIQRFIFFVWNDDMKCILDWLAAARYRRPQDGYHFLCSDEFHARELNSTGLSAIHVSHNAFLDEKEYEVTTVPMHERKFDAVCISRMNRFKRHQLACSLERVLFIGSTVAEGDDEAYFQSLVQLMPNAEMTHKETRWLQTWQVSQRLAHACSGLILSAKEGGSYATTEYMLCGLPVVSTASVGGRDCWLHPRYSRVVPPTPEAVAEAVGELKISDISPQAIRDHALRIICEQRFRFFELGQRIYEVHRCGADFARDFYSTFRSKMADWLPHEELMAKRPTP